MTPEQLSRLEELAAEAQLVPLYWGPKVQWAAQVDHLWRAHLLDEVIDLFDDLRDQSNDVGSWQLQSGQTWKRLYKGWPLYANATSRTWWIDTSDNFVREAESFDAAKLAAERYVDWLRGEV